MPSIARILVAALLVALCVGCGSVGRVGVASCVAPYLDGRAPGVGREVPGETATVSPGGTVTVYGHWYTTTCNDTGQGDPLKPMPPVRLTLKLPGGAEKDLGTFKPAGPGLGFTAHIDVPAGTRPGRAEVRDDQATPATFTFKVGAGVPEAVDSGS